MLYTITHKLGGNLNPANQLLQQQKKPSALSAALAPLWQTVTSVDEKKQMSKKDLLKYAQGAFDIDDETHNRLMEEVKDEKVQLTFLHTLGPWEARFLGNEKTRAAQNRAT